MKYKYEIGIGITVHNRHEIAIQTLRKLIEFTPNCDYKLIIVDDGSAEPFYKSLHEEELNYIDYHHRFKENVGIAKAKNKCLEMLDDCEHIFLFDDDFYPIVDNWWEPYICSTEPHLMYIFKDFATPIKLNDTIVLTEFTTDYNEGIEYTDYNEGIEYIDAGSKCGPDKVLIHQKSSQIHHVAYSHARGVMLYFHNECLQKVGGYDPIFGRWGFEHADLSDRIYNAGLTRYRYMDVKDSNKLFYCADEHQAVKSTTWDAERRKWIDRNQQIYLSRKGLQIYVPYIEDKDNLVITTFFTGIPDPQRPGEKWEYKRETIQPLISSIEKHQQQLHILHDGCIAPAEFIGNPNVYTHIVTSHITPYFQRWISIRDFLIDNRDWINKVFCVDATDVEMLKNPFSEMEYGKIYTGDEPAKVNCPWMVNHHPNPTLQQWMKGQAVNLQLLNAGLLGGEVNLIIEFLTHLIDFYHQCQVEKHYRRIPDTGMTDMAAFNYIARTKFGNRISHGKHVNTTFKANERNETSWWKHK